MKEDNPTPDDDPSEQYYGYQVTRRMQQPSEMTVVRSDLFGRSPASPSDIQDAIDLANLNIPRREKGPKGRR